MKNKKATLRLSLALSCLLQPMMGWAQAPQFDIKGFQVEGNTLLPGADLEQALSPFKGEGREMGDVLKAAEAVRKLYTEAGYPIVKVYAPEQTVGSGANAERNLQVAAASKAAAGQIVLRVVEGRIAATTVSGNKLYDSQNILSSLPSLKPGQPVNMPDLLAEISLANENPGKQIVVNFQSGVGDGEVDARIDVTEDRLQKYYATLDNAGSRSTGLERLTLGYQHANVMNRDQVFNLQFLTTLHNPEKVLNLVGSYHIPFYEQRLSLDLIGAYSNTKTTTSSAAGPLAFTGAGSYVGARLNHPMTTFGEYRHKIVYGLDYKDFKNDCTLSGIVMPICGTVTTQPLSISYVVQMVTPAIQTGASIGYFANIAGGAHGSETEYGTRPRHWDAWRLSGFAGIPFAQDWQARATVNAQETSKILVPSEQFGIGGSTSVRGYDERIVAGDYGYSANLEIFTPEIGKAFGLDGEYKLRGLFFNDLGAARNNAPGLVREIPLSSIGFGFRLDHDKDISAKLDLGFVQKAVHIGNVHVAKNKSFGHLSITYTF